MLPFQTLINFNEKLGSKKKANCEPNIQKDRVSASLTHSQFKSMLPQYQPSCRQTRKKIHKKEREGEGGEEEEEVVFDGESTFG